MLDKVKKAVATVGTFAVMTSLVAVPTLANAQNTSTTVTGPSGGSVSTSGVPTSMVGIANNPISQWIVLSSLFAPGFLYGTTGTATVTTPSGNTTTVPTTSGIANNPISQWIVLSSLFAPGYLYGGLGGLY